MAKFDRIFSLFAGLLVALLAAPPPSIGAQVHVESNSILRLFQQEQGNGDEKTGVPGYEYLRVDAGTLDEDGFSFHGYGWGRYDFGDYFDDSSAGEILYGYVQYRRAEGSQFARLGRQYIFEGGANQTFDGLHVGTNVTPYFSVSAYGGQPVSLEEVNGRSGDRTWGGRVANHWSSYYEVGVSYKRVDNDGDKEVEFLAVDSSLTPSGPLALRGISRRNLVSDAWAEHSYEALVSLGKFGLRPHFERFDYEAYFGTGVDTGAPFRFLKDSSEVVTVLGTDGSWRLTDKLDLFAKLKHYDYRERDETSWYYAGSAVLHGENLSQLGGEVGRMSGDSDDNRYTLARAYFYWDREPGFVSGDVVYSHYDEDVLDKSYSAVGTLSAGRSFLSKALTLKLSGSYSSDPYFDRDLRGQVSAEYVFDAP